MKLLRRLASVMVAAVLVAAMPTFAASTNGVNKIITVAKDDVLSLESGIAPELKIQLKDDLDKGQVFYLNLNNAKWIEEADKTLNRDLRHNNAFEFTLLEGNKQMEVKAKDAPASKDEYRVPMLVQVTGSKAEVAIDSNGTVVSEGTYEFALSNSSLAKVSVKDAKAFAKQGKAAKVTLEEAHINAFKSNKKQTLALEIEEPGFTFDLSEKDLASILVGGKSYTNQKFAGKLVDNNTRLEVEIPANELDKVQRGTLAFDNLQIKAEKKAEFGDVHMVVSGDLNETETVLAAKHGDYGTKLTAAKKHQGVSGQKLDVEFTLEELVENSYNGSRETEFAFTEGVTIESLGIGKVTGLIEGSPRPKATIIKDNKTNTNKFVLKAFDQDNKEKTSVTFKATLDVPAAFDKDIEVSADGRSLEEAKEIKLAKVEKPVNIEVLPANLKVGVAKQKGGNITLEENSKGNIKEGKIFIALGNEDIKYTKAPEVAVTKGNLKLDEKIEIVPGGLEITVTRKSREASTIEVKEGELRVSGLAPAETKQVRIGGPSLSSYSHSELWNKDQDKYNDIDPVAEKDFLLVGTVANQAKFVIGESKYHVNEIEKSMDTKAYLSKEERIMLPIRYVSEALGVKPHQILWDGATKKATIIEGANNIVQIKAGSKDMLINGVTTVMSSAPEIKDNRVFIPVAEIGRALNTNVKWDNDSKTATFN